MAKTDYNYKINRRVVGLTEPSDLGLIKLVDSQQSKIESLEIVVREYSKNSELLVDAIDNTRKDIENLSKEKYDIIEIIGIFVAIFTFISVEIQILSKSPNVWVLICLSIAVVAGMSLFIFNLVNIIEKWVKGSDSKFKFIKDGYFLGGVFLFALSLSGLFLTQKLKEWHISRVDDKIIDLKERMSFVENELCNFSIKNNDKDKLIKCSDSISDLKKSVTSLNNEIEAIKRGVEDLKKE